MVSTEWTINAIKDAVRATGSHWFDPGTMRFFGTRVGETVYHGPGGFYFVTSEKPPHSPRAYTVRQFTPPGDIETVGEVASLSRGEAISEAKRLATTPLQKQFLAAVLALDVSVIDNPATTDRANQYRSLSIEEIAEGGSRGIVYMQDGGYTRYVARTYDSGGYYLQLIETGATDRKAAWSDAYKLQREVCRVLWTFASDAYAEAEAESIEQFKPISDADQFLDECRQHGDCTASGAVTARLMAEGEQHHHLMELLCSSESFCRGINKDGEHPQIIAIRKLIAELACGVGAKGVKFSGDPRGCTVKLLWHNGETNDFGKEGWCVPGA